ncbi:MAG: P1 family peptidase [Methanobacteriota archaeon]
MTQPQATLTSVRGVRVGHAHDARRRTGVTVTLFDRPAIAYADHRGGWPGDYDAASSALGKTFVERHALFLAGGDIYGYDAAIGIRRYLIRRGDARPSGGGEMPGIMGTNIYDLDFAAVEGADYAGLGARACRAASGRPVAQGNVGCGIGATVGPFFGGPGMRGTKGGLGSSAARIGRWTVGAIAVTNCVGNVFDPFVGRTIGGARRKSGKGFLEMDDVLDAYLRRSTTRSGTTIGIVGTDAPLDHEQLARLVELSHDGIALAVRPAHMSTDGDTILGFTTRRPAARRLDFRAFDVLHHVAVREMARAVVRGVYAAQSLGGLPGLADSEAVRRAASLES